MFSQSTLPDIFQTTEQTANELIIPGDLNLVPKLSPTPAEESSARGRFRVDWPEWVKPKGVNKIEGEVLTPFQSSWSLRRWGKEKIYQQLHMIPSGHIPNGVPSGPWEEIPQLPRNFINEVPNFEEVGLKQGEPKQDSAPTASRGQWGVLVSSLLQVPESVKETEAVPVTAPAGAPSEAPSEVVSKTPSTETQPVAEASILPSSKLFPILIGATVLLLLLKR